MCGLFGMVGFLEHKHKEAFNDLMFLSALRGKDSTGLTVVNREKMVMTRKMTVPTYEFMEYPQVKGAMRFGDQLWMGHARWKTTGAVTKSNAHPFEILDEAGDVMLVGTHNGTLTNKWDIENKLKGEKFDTDSEALFNLLVEAKDYKTAINSLKGAWSLVWWDPMEDTVHFCRNVERPLVFAWTKDRKVFIYASEAWMIINACRRNNVELETNEKGLSCYSTLADHLYSLKIPQERDRRLPDIVREGGYAGAPVNKFQQKWDGVFGNRYEQDEQWWDNVNGEVKKTTTPGTEKAKTNGAKDEPKSNVVTLGYPHNGSIRGFGGQILSKKEFEKVKAKGCVWCKDKIEDNLIFSFLNEDALCCVRCMRDTHPKGDDDYDADLDDDLPFDLTDKGKDLTAQGDSAEARRILTAAVGKGKKALGK